MILDNMVFIKGQTAWNKGKPLGFTPKGAFKKGQKPWHAGKKIDREKYPTFGHFSKHTEESKIKMSLSGMGKHDNDKNPAWKGDEAGYVALHNWVKRRLGKASKCINGHIAKQYYWANISGEYKRNLSDWHELCSSCNHLDGIRIHERFNIT